jgi:hypothetical protein
MTTTMSQRRANIDDTSIADARIGVLGNAGFDGGLFCLSKIRADAHSSTRSYNTLY